MGIAGERKMITKKMTAGKEEMVREGKMVAGKRKMTTRKMTAGKEEMVREGKMMAGERKMTIKKMTAGKAKMIAGEMVAGRRMDTEVIATRDVMTPERMKVGE